MQWWDEFWKWANENTLGATIVGGLIVAAVVALIAVIPKWRGPAIEVGRRLYGTLYEIFWSLASIRITTTTRMNRREAAIREEVRAELTGTPASKPGLVYRLVDQEEYKRLTAPPPTPEPVSWSARRRPDGEFVLTNLSNTDTAEHVGVSVVGLNWGWDGEPSWREVAPRQTVSFEARRDPQWPLGPQMTVVWEDKNGLAHEAHPEIRGI